jgi:hypothetical protein
LKIVYYTSGIPGSGRIVQGISIYNAIKRKNIDCDFIILSSTEHARLADLFNIKHIEIPFENETIITKDNYSNSILYKTLTELNPDILLVDRMWFTLFHFIEQLPCKKIFFSIQVHDLFFKIKLPNETLIFSNSQYDKVLAIEPFKSIVNMEIINPIIIRNRDEIYDRNTALAKLGLSEERSVALIALNFKEGYFEKMKNKYSYLEEEGYDVISTTNIKGGGIFPIVDYYNAFDLIACGSGYTQFWEAVYFNKEAIFEAFQMNFTNLTWRVQNCQEYYFEENGADQLVDIIMNL